MHTESNVQLRLALDFVQYTDKNLFLTGKAGTGKTTFLQNLKKISPKRMAVVAPTGVAAINAGGVTIHSFFQMPFGPFVPAEIQGQLPGLRENTMYKRFTRDKIDLIRSLDLLVIDEISMVRADTLDGIDEVLRRYKNPKKPFGGIQLLMIGDLHQLSPVVKDEDWKILKDFYPNLYFFSSKALMNSRPVCIELLHIYRQTDALFINLLNSIRERRIDNEVLNALNSRYIPGFNPSEDEGYIILTTHNQSANEINSVKLAAIDSRTKRFSASISDEFPEFSFPTVADLELKIGAQVMFIKNDPSREHLFYNGKIGKVVRFNEDSISVKCSGDLEEIEVQRLEWKNIKYELNQDTKEVEEKVIGTFNQYPLKLAWAITIHKSQGLTFEKAIIDANAAFAHGQVYVALSRCKSFEGLVLRSPIGFSSIKTDGVVSEFTNQSNKDCSDEQLNTAKISFQQSLLYELFDFSEMKTAFFRCRKHAQDHDTILAPALINSLNEINVKAEKDIYEVAETFKRQLGQLLSQSGVPEENLALQERIKKASSYFREKIEYVFLEVLKNAIVETDNKTIKKNISEALERLKKEVFVKNAVMSNCLNGFGTLAYLRARANADIDFAASSQRTTPSRKTSINIPNGDLYLELKRWRGDQAFENGVPVYGVLQQKTLLEIVTKLPSNLGQLERIKGIGKVKMRHYGKEILTIIDSYCERQGIERESERIAFADGKVKIDTKRVSLDLFKEGKTIAEIAEERGLSPYTIEGHLVHYVGTGELDVFSLVPREKVAFLLDLLTSNKHSSLTEAKTAAGDDISYLEIKAVIKHMQAEESV